MTPERATSDPHVVIVGAGFGGLEVAKSLGKASVRVTVIDRQNHHLFQPLLYQVAIAGLSPADIAAPTRSVLSRYANARVLMACVRAIDLRKRVVLLDGGGVSYDILVIAAGAKTDYFGHDEWAERAPGLKSVDDAIEIRRRVLTAFERAEREEDADRRRALLTFVVIGGGPTGVELAGAIAELSCTVLARDFRTVNPKETRVVLIEGGTRILPAFDEVLSRRAEAQLASLGVEVRTDRRVTKIDGGGVHAGDDPIEAATVLWAAGVRAASITKSLGVPLDRNGRVPVGRDCSMPGQPEVFVIGDAARFVDDAGQALPGLSPVALQQGRFVAKAIRAGIAGLPRGEFRYVDKGIMATIGRSRAVAQSGRLRLSGLPAWLAWLFIHVFYLIGFRNRLVVMITWAWSYLTYNRGARLITGRTRSFGPACGSAAGDVNVDAREPSP